MLAGVNHVIDCITNIYLTAGVTPVSKMDGTNSIDHGKSNQEY